MTSDTETSSAPPVPRRTPAWRRLLTGAVVVLLLAVLAWSTRSDGRLHIFFLDTAGDAALVQTPEGGYILVDGGADPAALALLLGRHMPFWQRRLDAVVLTRGDQARLPGQVAALSRYRAELALVPELWPQPVGEPLHLAEVAQHLHASDSPAPDVALLHEWLRLLDEQETRLLPAPPGTRIAPGGVLLTLLPTAEQPAAHLVLQLEYGSTRVVFAGAAEAADDAALLAHAQPLTLLAYPWQREMHTPLMEAWQPRALLFTTAYEAPAPAELTYAERSRYGSALYHQRINGTVELVSDGRTAWIEPERQ